MTQEVSSSGLAESYTKNVNFLAVHRRLCTSRNKGSKDDLSMARRMDMNTSINEAGTILAPGATQGMLLKVFISVLARQPRSAMQERVRPYPTASLT